MIFFFILKLKYEYFLIFIGHGQGRRKLVLLPKQVKSSLHPSLPSRPQKKKKNLSKAL
jgi:hypothetical protein